MHQIQRFMTNICSADLPKSKAFYTALFQFEVNFESDWFVQLRSADGQVEIGIIDRFHNLVPADFQQAPQGVYLTFVVEDVEAVYATAQAAHISVLAPPADTFYGQRRMLLQDPDGTLVDVSSLMAG